MVIVPMVGVAVVLVVLTRTSETGKADAAIAGAVRNALVVYNDAAIGGRPALREVAGDTILRRELAAGRRGPAARRIALLQRADRRIAAIELYGPGGGLATRAGSAQAIAAASVPVTRSGGRRVGTLSVSVTRAGPYARRVARLS